MGIMQRPLQAADLFAQKKEVEAWTAVAKGYTKVGDAEQARKAWQQVQRGAASSGDHTTAQVAEINGAFTWVIEGQASKAVALLKKITQTPANGETAGLSWFVLGQAYVKMKDVRRAREAFEKARTFVPPDHPVARQASAALTGLRE
jgi:Tfp pilus assembly protein PilF